MAMDRCLLIGAVGVPIAVLAFVAAKRRFSWKAADAAASTARQVTYVLKASLVCRSRHVKYVANRKGRARLGRPGPDEPHVVALMSPGGRQMRILMRGNNPVPPWWAVDSDITDLENFVMYGELHVVHEDGTSSSTDMTELVYHLSPMQAITPVDVSKLVHGTEVARTMVDCYVEIVTLDTAISFLSDNIIHSLVFW